MNWRGSRLPWLVGSLGFAGLIFYFSTVPMTGEEPFVGFSGVDKAAHGVEFFILTLLAIPALPRGYQWKRKMVVIISLTAGYGAFIELYQGFLPTRGMSIYDWGADLIGIGGAIVLATVKRIRD